VGNSISTVASPRLASLPQGLEAVTVAAVAGQLRRHTAVGWRDFAILVLLVRLGLRAGEVTALRLDDIDWRAGELVVRGKGSRLDRLPLPQDVGRRWLLPAPRVATIDLLVAVRAGLRA
jgi:site-specific recombinase XerC